MVADCDFGRRVRENFAMTVYASGEAARATRRRGESNGASFWLTSFLGANRYFAGADRAPPDNEKIYPMAFLVEQDPGCTVQAHFHQADQFQVVVGGAARLGTHDVTDVAVHFSNRFSAYGPIRASERGVHYFTLRNGWDPGARYMPGAREELRQRRSAPHREAVAGPVPPASRTELAAIDGVQCAAVMKMEADGLGAWRYRLPPGGRAAGPDPAVGRGQTWLVVGDALERGAEERLPGFSCLFVYPSEAPLELVAGADGAELLCMQYPRR